MNEKHEAPTMFQSLRNRVRLLTSDSARTQVQDKVVREKKDDLGLIPRKQPKATQEEAFSMEDDTGKHSILIKTTAAGAVIGGAVGGLFAYSSAMNEVNSKPVNSVSLDWDRPVMHDKMVGQIPNDYYEPNNVFGYFHQNTMKNVVEPAPVVDSSGHPQMEHTAKTFTDHGQPVVHWNEKSIRDPYLNGYSDNRWEDGHDVAVGQDKNGNTIYEHRIDGWQHNFYPRIGYTNIGSFKKPDVTFETGVNVAERTVLGILLGMGAGAAAAALIRAGIEKAMESKK
jgi:hypothetical protein